MEVKDVFLLRKQGKIEEAYQAITPMYAQHKGHYTTIAMFWVGLDILKKRMKERRIEEAYKILTSLIRLYEGIEDKDFKGQSALINAALIVSKHHKAFSFTKFIGNCDVTKLSDNDWKMKQANDHLVASLGMRIVQRVLKEVKETPTVEYALCASNILNEALKYYPFHLDNQRLKAIIYCIMGQKDKAIEIYKYLLRNHKLSYLYQEMANFIEDKPLQIAFLCQAILLQRNKRFRQRMHFQLASVLYYFDKQRARYELDQCLAIKRSLGYPIKEDISFLHIQLSNVYPCSAADEYKFYRSRETVIKNYLG